MTEVWLATFLIICKRFQLTLSLLFVVLLKVLHYPFIEPVLQIVLLQKFFFDYNCNFYVSHSKLGFESVKFRRWFRKLCTFLKIKRTDSPKDLFHLISNQSFIQYSLAEIRNSFFGKTHNFKYSFFPSIILEWNQTWWQNTVMYNYVLFQKFFVKDWSTYS